MKQKQNERNCIRKKLKEANKNGMHKPAYAAMELAYAALKLAYTTIIQTKYQS
jgi:hypothetical protein